MFYSLSAFLLLFVSEDQVSSSIKKTIEIMYEKLEEVDQRLVGAAKIEAIKEDIRKTENGPVTTFLVNSGKIINTINGLEKKNYNKKGQLFGDAPGSDSVGEQTKDYTEAAVNAVVKEIQGLNNTRIALFPFSEQISSSDRDPLKNYQTLMFYNGLKAAFRNQKILVLTGEDLTEACVSAGVDLENVKIEKLDGIIRFLKATKIDYALLGSFGNSSVIAYLVDKNGGFKSVDSSVSVDRIIREIPQQRFDFSNQTPGVDFNKQKVRIYFEVLQNERWEKLDVISDKKAEFWKVMLYLVVPDDAIENKSKFRIRVINYGQEPEGIQKANNGLGRLMGVDITVDGISVFLDEGKGEPSIPGQGRKLLMSSPGFEVNFEKRAGVRTGKDNSNLIIGGFLDDKLSEEKQFYFGNVDDAFAMQFLGTNLKPLGLITVDLFMQKLQGDKEHKDIAKAGPPGAKPGPGGVGIRAGRGVPVEIKIIPKKLDYYNDQNISNTFSYKKKSDLKELIPQENWFYYRD